MNLGNSKVSFISSSFSKFDILDIGTNSSLFSPNLFAINFSVSLTFNLLFIISSNIFDCSCLSSILSKLLACLSDILLFKSASCTFHLNLKVLIY